MGKRRKCNILIESNKESEDSKAMTLELNNSQDKSPTNAFQLLMESRLKSIGSNSPGKHRPVAEPECQELVDKRELKAKRILSLQKMAEAKGSLKNKELEDFRDRSIKKQLSIQAEKFKDMLRQENSESKNKTYENKEHSLSDIEIIDVNDTHLLDVKKTLQLCNMFEKSDAEGFSKKLTNKKVSTEDIEFLSKLSPSIRKKENMMSYFPKVEEKVVNTDNPDNEVEITDTIKVKFKSKIMKKISHRRNKAQNCINNPQNENKTRKLKMSECTTSNLIPINDTEVRNVDKRPKRKTKRPAKYLDDNEVSSSDEELYIFTPKKKKNSVRFTVSESTLNLIGMKEICEDKNPSVKENHENAQSQIKSMKCSDNKSMNPIKLAPIFTSKLSNLSEAEKEARQKFLHSGIPQKLKKDNSQSKNNTANLEFHPVVHIQQNIAKTFDKIEINFSSLSESSNESTLETNDNLFKSLTSLDEEVKQAIPPNQHNQENLLHLIKHSYHKFPVYRTYHLLKGKSNGENKDFNYSDLDNSIEIIHDLPNDFDSIDKLCWVEKYKPTSTKQIIGNFAAIDELKKWLQSWTENLVKTKKDEGSGSSDFDDFQDSDAESRDTLRTSNNVLVICGDVGSGKTSSVYAVAAELAIKVIEVNSSSKRTGKIMLQDLQEATRSHKVDRGKSNSDNSQKLQETAKPKLAKKRGRPKKAKESLKNVKKIESMKCIVECSLTSQDSLRTDSSLILIDDADIVFEQDDGFCSAISQLIQSSKRPVILITSSLSCQHLQKFIQLGKIIKMHKFLPRMLGTWLDIMCVADTGICFPGLGDGLLDYYKGDIRKTIHSLQFYMVTYKHSTYEHSQGITHDKLSIEDENSCLSWTDEYNTDKTTQPITSKNIVQQHIKIISLGAPLDLLSVWWSISNVYESHIENDNLDSKQLILISNGLCIISEADCLTKRSNICNKMWYPKESASLNETQIYEYYNRNDEVSKDIARELGVLGLKCATNCKSEVIMDISAPGYYTEREQEKIASRHHTLSSYLNLGVVLDRRALALDYWPTCRTICRLEKNVLNTKRNNRFCHYLKSLNVLCKNDYFDALSKSLNNAL
ncbi:ATPase family AAA domain-containing protein 5 [Pieris rapae]|uniref:ATPase family AAA domain-containing protein 5 n=1 Tax=Pieris rapae TaxID=64459 RepID=UPI001E27E537|nr:ATPase family AAA domain-containing protein 5 [Pieris rapae]